MTAKRFTVDSDGKYWDRESNKYVTIDHLFYLVEKLEEENEQLKSQLRIYRKIASCSNCDYHDYDEFDNNDGSYDEFEVCRKGNDVTERICKEWKEL